jgi:lipopolysaccharide transport system ATP-binding protein
MSRSVIQLEGLGKRYRIGQPRQHNALSHVIGDALRAPARLLRGSKHESGGQANGGLSAAANTSTNHRGSSFIWALKDVSFDVKEGEVVGLIGRNGAGKSTLLKILARVTRPTEGHGEIHGRVGSLLEVGTGFHPELTGRENVFMSGAVLGMRKAEIDRKFDEIVAFSEVERFLDTPLKHYSSGMQMRLAFAVAAHLEHEILLVDEVLAVGDLSFQKKCLRKMQDVSATGRTIIFISHQVNQIRRLCTRAIWLDSGEVRESGAVAQVLASYESVMMSRAKGNGNNERAPESQVKARFLSWEVLEPRAEERNMYASFETLKVRFILQVNRRIQSGHHGIALFNSGGQLIWGTACDNLQLDAGTYTFVYSFPTLPLRPGVFTWRVSLYEDGSLVDAWDCLPDFVVATRPVTHPRDEWTGILNVPCEFNVGNYNG